MKVWNFGKVWKVGSLKSWTFENAEQFESIGSLKVWAFERFKFWKLGSLNSWWFESLNMLKFEMFKVWKIEPLKVWTFESLNFWKFDMFSVWMLFVWELLTILESIEQHETMTNMKKEKHMNKIDVTIWKHGHMTKT